MLLVQNHTCRSFAGGPVFRPRASAGAWFSPVRELRARMPHGQRSKAKILFKECLPLPLIFFLTCDCCYHLERYRCVCVCTCSAGACQFLSPYLRLAVCTLSHFYHYKWFRGHKETVAERGLKLTLRWRVSWNLDTGRCFSWYPGPDSDTCSSTFSKKIFF